MRALVRWFVAAIASKWRVLVLTALFAAISFRVGFVLWKLPVFRLTSAVLGICAFIIALLWQLPKWQVRSIGGLETKDRFDSENEARKTLSQILGGLALLIGFYFTWQNLVLTRQGQLGAEKAAQENIRIVSEGQITDRFTRAIAQLGDNKLEIRLGGIYALERIDKDSPRDHWSIMEVLTAYVREHAKVSLRTKHLADGSVLKAQHQLPKPAVDIQAILTIIGRRTMTFADGETFGLDLHETDLSGASLFDANLNGAWLSGVQLRRATLSDAHLDETDLDGADLRGAFLDRAELDGADLSQADLRGANLDRAILTNADLRHASFDGATLTGAIFTDARLNRANLAKSIGLKPGQLDLAEGDNQTKLPPYIPRPKSWEGSAAE